MEAGQLLCIELRRYITIYPLALSWPDAIRIPCPLSIKRPDGRKTMLCGLKVSRSPSRT